MNAAFFHRYKSLITTFVCLLIFMAYALCSNGVIDEGDAINHYLISRFAFDHPRLLLDLWGKPLFTLLTAPFAAFGFKGVLIFNVLAGTTTAYITYRSAKKMKLTNAFLVIPVVLFCPVFFRSILAGHTEVLCALLFISSAYLMQNKRYVSAALLASLLPFSRPEGYIILAFFAIAFLLKKRMRYLPLLCTGFLIYTLIGWFHYGDMLWILHKSPYDFGNDLYGHGDPWHFIRSYRGIVGNPIIFILCPGILMLMANPFINDRSRRIADNFVMKIVLIGSLLGVVIAHSIAWWKGLFGSFGLIRVMSCVLPSLALLWLVGWQMVERQFLVMLGRFKWVASILYFSLILYVPLKTYRFPIAPKPQERLIQEAADWYKSNVPAHVKIYYQHPCLIYKLGADAFDDNITGMMWSMDRQEPGRGIEAGSLVFWDGKFSPVEGGIPLANMYADTSLQLLKVIKPEKEILEMWGTPFEIHIFQKRQNKLND